MKSLFFIFLTLIFSCGSPDPVKKTEVAEPFMLTPPPPLSPRISGPKVYGVRPGSPFIYRIPCTGERPIVFSAENLPDNLVLESATGIIAGSVPDRGVFPVLLQANNRHGNFRFILKIVAGDTLALTPPMGWNSWYIHYDRISDSLMRKSADRMIATGMADFGYQYVNIDDCWMVKMDSDDPVIGGEIRTGEGTLRTNRRFPDMKKLTDYIHQKGLKAGIYISPGPSTCAGYTGSYLHESIDARTFAEWGFDFLKYDWCSYGKIAGDTLPEDYIKPYRIISEELKKQRRDIVLNLCQYGMKEVWKWGGEVGHSWRTTGDLGLEKGRDLPGFYSIGFKNARLWPYARPGAWNDPDYILIGWVGDAHVMGKGEPVKLTSWQQYSYMSMWSLMAAPLIFSGDMEKLDPFTLNVLCNHEVIDINQDALGRQAFIARLNESELVLSKEMEDGSVAVGLFNLTERRKTIHVVWNELNISGPKKIRDAWKQIDIGTFAGEIAKEIEPHGVFLFRAFTAGN